MNKKVTTTTTTTTTVIEEQIVPKNKTIHYHFVLDRSGSMDSIWKSTVDSFNEQIGALREVEIKFPHQKHLVTLTVFDNEIETLFSGIRLDEVKKFEEFNVEPRGLTSLYDAIGISISKIKTENGALLNESPEENEAFIVVLTDGGENNSKEYRAENIRSLISEIDTKKNWSIILIGSDISTLASARSILGFGTSNTISFMNTGAGMNSASCSVTNTLHRKAYASTRGVNLDDKYAYFSSSNGAVSASLDLSDIDNIANGTASGSASAGTTSSGIAGTTITSDSISVGTADLSSITDGKESTDHGVPDVNIS